MKKYLACLVLLVLGCPKIVAQSLDSLESVILAMPNDTSKYKKINQLAARYEDFDLSKSIAMLRRALPLAQKLGRPGWIADTHSHLGADFANQGEPDSALFHFHLAQQGYEKLGNQQLLAMVLANIRYVHNFRGDFESANKYSFDALAIYERLGDGAGIAYSFIDIGENLGFQKKYPESLEYFQKAYDLNKKRNDLAGLALAAQYMGGVFLNQNQCEKALQLQDEALEIRRKRDDQTDLVLSLINRASALKCLERFDEALQNLQEALKLARQIGFVSLEFDAVSEIGAVHQERGDFQKALPWHLKHYEHLVKSGQLVTVSSALNQLSATYAGLGRFDSAYFFKEKQLVLGDSLLNAGNQKRMSELQTKYETSQKEAKISGQETEISRQKTVIWLVGGMLALVLAGGFFLFRLNQKLNKRNEEKEFLIKEIHHRVKNNLQVLSSLLHLQSREIKDEAALDAVREGQNRVDAMGLIHQKLYMGENIAGVEMQDYLQNLGDTLLDSFGLDERVKIKYLLEPLHLDVDTAIPLGLIINELLTNSLKYAFPDGRTGEVEIKLWKDGFQKLCLQISDDGPGKNAAPDAKNSTGFGSKLVQILSQKLKGKPEIVASENGYSTLIKFENFKMAS